MKSIYKNKKIKFLIAGLALVLVASLGFFVQSCSQEDDPIYSSEQLDSNIVNAPELEDLIIAGAEYNRALVDLENEFNKIDFSTLEVTYDAEGRKVVHLPTTFVETIKLDEKALSLYEKKEVFRNKFPQFSSFSEGMGKKYFQQCAQNSVNVKNEFLKLGINTTQPRLKSGSEIEMDENFSQIIYLLNALLNDPTNYKEVYIIGYADGSYEIVKNPDATDSSNGKLTITYNYTKQTMSYNGKQITSVGHPHTDTSDPTPNTLDENGEYVSSDYIETMPGVSLYIYFQGELHYY